MIFEDTLLLDHFTAKLGNFHFNREGEKDDCINQDVTYFCFDSRGSATSSAQTEAVKFVHIHTHNIQRKLRKVSWNSSSQVHVWVADVTHRIQIALLSLNYPCPYEVRQLNYLENRMWNGLLITLLRFMVIYCLLHERTLKLNHINKCNLLVGISRKVFTSLSFKCNDCWAG